MNFKLCIVSGILSAAMSAHGTIIVLSSGSPDNGPLDAVTETYTANVTNFNGTDASFDLVLTAVATGGTWSPGDAGEAAISGGTANRVDTDEDASFSLAIANWSPGTSGYGLANIDFGIVELRLDGAFGGTDSGKLSLLNGAPPSSPLIWTDMNNGAASFTGDLDPVPEFDLQLVNDTYGSGSRLTSFTHEWEGALWRYESVSIEYAYQAIPEPSSLGLFGAGLALLAIARHRIQGKTITR